MLRKLASLVFLAASLAPAAAAGPYEITVPVDGLSPARRPALVDALRRHLGEDPREVELTARSVTFVAGGRSATQLVRLSSLEAAVADAGGRLARERFRLRPQEVGLTVSAVGGLSLAALDRALARIEGPSVTPFGTILDGARVVRVVRLDGPLDLAGLERTLAAAGARLDDLAWSHWHHGFGLESDGPGPHSHHAGATDAIVGEGGGRALRAQRVASTASSSSTRSKSSDGGNGFVSREVGPAPSVSSRTSADA